MTTGQKSQVNAPTLDQLSDMFRKSYAELEKTTDGKRVIARTLFVMRESDDGALTTIKLPLAESCAIVRHHDGTYSRDSFRVYSFDKNGQVMTQEVSVSPEKRYVDTENRSARECAFNSYAVALGRAYVNVCENAYVDSSTKTTRTSARASAAIAELQRVATERDETQALLKQALAEIEALRATIAKK